MWLAQVDWGLLMRNVMIHPDEIKELKQPSHMTLHLLPGHWQVQPEPEANWKDPATPLSRLTVVDRRNPTAPKMKKLHKRSGSRTYGSYPEGAGFSIGAVLHRVGVATELRRSTRRVGGQIKDAWGDQV